MSYTLDPGAALEPQFRAIAHEKLDDVYIALAEAGTGDAEAVHTARKRLKRLRGLLRLVRDADRDFYAAGNERLRNAARHLADLRDTQALAEALDRIAPPGAFPATRAAIAPVAPPPGADTGPRDRALADAHTACTGFALRVPFLVLPAGADAARILARGMGRTHKRARKALKAARRDRSALAFHELRKRVKYHWMHVSLLRDLVPDAETRRPALKALSDRLGDLHDLDMLRAALRRSEDLPYGEVTRCLDVIAAARRNLADDALAAAGPLLGTRPRDLKSAIGARWPVRP